MRICYFGAYDPKYARNQFLRRALTLNGCEIIHCNVPQRMPTWQKYPRLIAQYLRTWRQCDLLIVPEFAQLIVPLAWLLGRLTGRRVVFDQVIAMYEAVVLERKQYAPASLQARKFLWLDQLAMRLADLVLTGTTPYRQFLIETFGAQVEKIVVAPLGVDPSTFEALPAPPNTQTHDFHALYFGAYVPNHGTQTIIQAAHLLEQDGTPLRLTMIGSGTDKAATVALSGQLQLQSVQFIDWVEPETLPGWAESAHVILGVFGNTPQANHAMANKVLQGLAMKRAVLSGDSAATRENFTHGEHLWLCAPGDPQALADGLRTLMQDASLRQRLANDGHERLIERLSPEKVGERLLEALRPLARSR